MGKQNPSSKDENGIAPKAILQSLAKELYYIIVNDYGLASTTGPIENERKEENVA